MATHALNVQAVSWNSDLFPAEISTWSSTLNDPNSLSPLRMSPNGTVTGAQRTILSVDAARAIIAYIKRDDADMALVDTGNGMTYSAEKTLPDGTTLVATVNRPSFQSNTLNLRASIVTAAGAYTPIPPLSRNSTVDLSPVFLCLLAHCNRVLSNRFRRYRFCLQHTMQRQESLTARLSTSRRIADSLVFILNEKLFDVAVPGSNIDMLAQQSVTMGSLNGVTICGTPNILAGINGVKRATARTMTFAEAKAKFKSFAQKHEWSDEERALIPVFPEDYKVPQEAIKTRASMWLRRNRP